MILAPLLITLFVPARLLRLMWEPRDITLPVVLMLPAAAASASSWRWCGERYLRNLELVSY